MPFPILAEADLPALNSTCERPDIDFNDQVPPKADLEHAKDVAALANTVGGSIIIGSETRGKTIVIAYPGLPPTLAVRLPQAYEQATKDRCRPSPRLASQVIALPSGNEVVVINVWPSPLAPVGVRVDQQGEEWSFPIRVGSHTRHLQPDQFGSLESVSARRAAALLIGIPEEERKRMSLRFTKPNPSGGTPAFQFTEHVAALASIDPERNVALFLVAPAPLPAAVPLDWIDAVWRETVGPIQTWIVGLSCVLEPVQGAYKAVSLNRG